MIILGIDPGGTTGWALVEAQKKRPMVRQLGETRDATLEDIEKFFEEADVIVVEDFLVRPKKAQAGDFNYNPMNTTRVIGAAQTLARIRKKKFVLQQPAIKPMGYGYAGLKYVPGKKGMHQYDAVAHAVFYLVKNHLAYPVGNDLPKTKFSHPQSSLPKSHNSQAFELHIPDIPI